MVTLAGWFQKVCDWTSRSPGGEVVASSWESLGVVTGLGSVSQLRLLLEFDMVRMQRIDVI
jgi:hypothetical protein